MNGFCVCCSLETPTITKVESVDTFLKAYNISFRFEFYNSSTDHDEQPSGAYIFRPDSSEKTTVVFDQMETFESDLVTEYWFTSSEVDWASVVARRSVGEMRHLEFEWLAGPLPAAGSGIEAVMTYQIQVTKNGQNTLADDQVMKTLLDNVLHQHNTA